MTQMSTRQILFGFIVVELWCFRINPIPARHRGSYMSVHVLLNLLNEFYHMTIKIAFICDVKTSSFCHHVRNVVMDVITFPVNR